MYKDHILLVPMVVFIHEFHLISAIFRSSALLHRAYSIARDNTNCKSFLLWKYSQIIALTVLIATERLFNNLSAQTSDTISLAWHMLLEGKKFEYYTNFAVRQM